MEDLIYCVKNIIALKNNKELQKEFNNEVDKKTKEYQKVYNCQIGSGKYSTWNNEADAFKHAYMSAILSIRYGELSSVTAGLKHEIENLLDGNKKSETNMDLHNNYEGYKIAREIKKEINYKNLDKDSKLIDDIVAKKIIERMRKGKLILKPNDQRAKTIESKIKDGLKYFERNKSSCSQSNSESGHWVTINGNHVKLD